MPGGPRSRIPFAAATKRLVARSMICLFSDDKVISMYASGLAARAIQGDLNGVYAVEVSPALIAKVTSAVMDDVGQWQNRSLYHVHPVVIFEP